MDESAVKESILELLRKSGLKIYGDVQSSEEAGEENNIEHNTPVEITGKDIKIYPHYNNNFGFFTRKGRTNAAASPISSTGTSLDMPKDNCLPITRNAGKRRAADVTGSPR